MEPNNILTFFDENDEAVEFEIIDSFEIADIKYAALATPEDSEDEESEVYIMRIESESSGEDILVSIEDDDEILVSIEDDDELDRAFQMFKDRCSEEFDILD